MYETKDDLRTLETLLDASYARSGRHLRSIWPEETRLAAEAVSSELAGLQVLDLATVTPRGDLELHRLTACSSAVISGSARPKARSGFATSAQTRPSAP